MDNLLETFCDVDDFSMSFIPVWTKLLLTTGLKQRQRARSLILSAPQAN